MSQRLQLALFFCAVVCFSMAMGIHDSIFNNYLWDTYGLSAGERGWLEFPRELPGFLVVLMAGILAALAVTHMAVVATLTFAAGMVGIMLVGPRFWPMVGMMMVGSAGMHLLQPAGQSIVLGLSGEHNRGRRIGITGAIGNIGVALGGAAVWIVFKWAPEQYAWGFIGAAGMAAAAAVFYTMMHIPHLHQKRARLVVRKKYRLYYLLEVLFGARKQIFITFGFWVLIDVYGQEASGIGQLLMTAALVGIVFKPLVGAAIDRFGERNVLIADGLILAVVCLGYGYAMHLAPNPAQALLIAQGCFILDSLLFSLGSGRAIYLSRIAESPEDLTSSLAMGVSINHVASMSIPAVAGVVWEVFGYERVFLAAALLAVGVSCASTLVPRKAPRASGDGVMKG